LRRTRSRKKTLPNPTPIEEGVRDLFDQLRDFLIALWLPPGSRVLSFLILARVFVICATAAAQVALNAWNGLFYEAIAERNFRPSQISFSFYRHCWRPSHFLCGASLAS
jgi:ABC-type uncharacterized transport system fused permease/ATPase subunit